MEDNKFLEEYFGSFHEVFETGTVREDIKLFRDALLATKKNGGKVMLAGNGASASMASHFALDFTKQGKVRSVCFNDAALLTAYGNDYGYERCFEMSVQHQGDSNDLVVLISSSGTSPNVVAAAKKAKEMGIKIVTLTGFEPDNALKSLGDVNLWADCRAYNIIESAHAFWLAATCDLIIGKSEYSVAG